MTAEEPQDQSLSVKRDLGIKIRGEGHVGWIS
jgi:hypothetical protein